MKDQMRHTRCLAIALVPFFCSVAAADELSDADLSQFAEQISESEEVLTPAAIGLGDRLLAESMIEYGRRTKSPEVILSAIAILHKNPLTAVKGDADEGARLEELIEAAASMRPEDESVLLMAERTAEMLEESNRGLAGGPKAWRVPIAKGKYYQLDPRLVYNAHEKAIIAAEASDPKTMIGITVRAGAGTKIKTRAAKKGRVVVDWNAGIQTTGWDVRIYNCTGKGDVTFTIQTN